METILANIAGKTRREFLSGKWYVIAPLTLIVPGVLNGSQGSLFYPPDEVSRNPEDWNHIPIVVYHPVRNGVPVSARDPEVLNTQGIGFVFRAVAKGSLTAEGWFDEEAVRRIDPRILDSLEAGRPIELSTGLFTENRPAQPGAVHNSPNGPIPYTHTAHNYKPDHLAILPDQTGACAIRDGCGVLVNSEEYDNVLEYSLNTVKDYLLLSDLHTHLVLPGTAEWIEDARDGVVIYRQQGKTYKQQYSLETDATGQRKVTIGTNPAEEVKLIGGYYRRPKSKPTNLTTPITTNEETMNRNQLIGWLTTNCDCWKDADGRKALDTMTDAKLLALKSVAEKHSKTDVALNAARKLVRNADGGTDTTNPGGVDLGELASFLGITTDPAKDPAGFIKEVRSKLGEIDSQLGMKDEPNVTDADDTAVPDMATPPVGNRTTTKPKTNTQGNVKSPTMQEWLKSAPPEAQAVWNNAVEVSQRERTTLVEQIVANAGSEQQKVSLRPIYQGMPLPQLRTIAQSIAPVGNGWNGNDGGVMLGQQGNSGSLYIGGSGGPVGNVGHGSQPQYTNNGEDDILALPVMEYEPIGQKRKA